MDKASQDYLFKAAVIGVGGYVAVKYLGKIIDTIKNAAKPGDSEDDTAEIVNKSSDPGSPWSSQYWKKAPAGSLLLTEAGANAYAVGIYASESWYHDDFAGALSIFKRLKTKSQVSYLADYFSKLYGSDLAAFLIGDTWPSDGFSKSQVDTIMNYVDKLPAYKA